MIKSTAQQIQELMDNPDNIRNISIIASMSHGKSTLTNALVTKAGVFARKMPDDGFYTDTREDEKERGISIKSTSVSLHYEYDITGKEKPDSHFINFIDTPGHVEFAAEVTAALRLTDGALVVVDCIEGVYNHTETILRQALIEKVRPALMINTIDRQILELQLDAEAMYQRYVGIVNSLNGIVAQSEQPDMGDDLLLHPTKGNVAFGSALHGWAFTLTTFARIYAKKFNVNMEKMREKLWGDNYYDIKTKKWFEKPVNEEGEPLTRAFSAFIMEPIIKLSRSIMEGNTDQRDKLLASLEISLSSEEKELSWKRLLKLIMARWINVADTLLEMMVLHLPSPKVAQKYRVSYLYEGPQDDDIAASFRDCNPKGPLIIYVSKMVPTATKERFFALGRVFGGTVYSGQKVRIMGPDYVPGMKDDLFVNTIEKAVLMMGKEIEFIPEVPCGNIIGLVGIDQHLRKAATITDSDKAHCIRDMKYSVSPLVQVTVEPRNPADLSNLIEGLRKLSKSDPIVLTSSEEDGTHIVAGSGELHLNICLNDLKNEYSNCGIKISDPFVSYRETVTAISNQICLSKSANKHNRIYATAEPLAEKLSTLIEASEIGPKVHPKERETILCGDFGWDKKDAGKIWAFGPEGKGPNVLVDVAHDIQHWDDTKDLTNSAFQWATKEGVLANESMRGVRINIVDILRTKPFKYHDIPSGGQILVAARRVYYAAELTAEPRLLEPIFLAEIATPSETISSVSQYLDQRRVTIVEKEQIPGTSVIKMKAYLPIVESFGNVFVVYLLSFNLIFKDCN